MNVQIVDTHSTYSDNDILEILHAYKAKAHHNHIQLTTKDIPDVEIIGLH